MHERLFLVGDIYKLLISRIAGDGELLSSANLSAATTMRRDLRGLICCGNAWPRLSLVSPRPSGSSGAASMSRSLALAVNMITSISGVSEVIRHEVQSQEGLLHNFIMLRYEEEHAAKHTRYSLGITER